MEFQIDIVSFRAALTAVETCMSEDETRPHLNCVRFEADPGTAGKGRLRMIATDGHRLAVWEGVADCTIGGSMLLRADSVAAVLGAVKGRKVGTVLVDGAALKVDGPEGTVSVALGIDNNARFPPWEQVMPTNYGPGNLGVAAIGVSAVYLAEACKAFAGLAKALGRRVPQGVTMSFGDDALFPILMSADIPEGRGSSLRIIIMPMRLDADKGASGREMRWQRGEDGPAVRRQEREIRAAVRQ